MTTSLVIEARDLDTDARTRASVDVVAPADEPGQKAQIVTAVARLHPQARLRSFARGAATFLDRQHLIVVHYERLPTRRRAPDEPAPALAQDQLFAG